MVENYDEVSEQVVVGRCIKSQEAYDAVCEIISPEDFFFLNCRSAYIALQNLYETGEPVDAITVNAAYLKLPHVEDDGNTLAWLIALSDDSHSFNLVKNYAEMIRDYSIARKLTIAGHQISSIGEDIQISATDKLKQTTEVINPILESSAKAGFISSIDASVETLENMQRLYESGSAITGLTTGFSMLDTYTAGLQNSDLIIMAGRPSMGKSLLSMNIACHVARTNPVLVFSLEMPYRALSERMFSSLGGIEHGMVRNGTAMGRYIDNLHVAGNQIKGQQLYMDDRGSVTIDEIRSRARIGKRLYGCRLVVVDYLQLIRCEGESQNIRIGIISASLKSMAKELECPVIAISQLNRSVDSRPDKRPLMSDLRDSGSIEQDADIVTFNYLDEKYDSNSHMRGIGELIIRKNRNGEIGTIFLNFEGPLQRFTTRNEAVPQAPQKTKVKKSEYRYKDESTSNLRDEGF